ncbi:hypothetical protein NQ317_015307 [Molorchus minor]|uniref:C2 domain-containing protein n=1 Tax=Molorchus minor TaxID=1323400 RepID=A0ABQ9ISW3_9CUCU|nr:hypothetical protein NQ317_015307 [Molorchus minor]
MSELKVKPFKKPDPYIILTVGKKQQKTKIKKHTIDPIWEEGFSLLVSNPENDSLIISILDKHTDVKIDHLTYNIRNLFDKPGLQVSKEEFELSTSGTIILSFQLRILTNELFEDVTSESDSEEDLIRHDSIRSNISTKTGTYI